MPGALALIGVVLLVLAGLNVHVGCGTKGAVVDGVTDDLP
jgi:hypothetical protein